MRMIDAEKLKDVLENVKNHLEAYPNVLASYKECVMSLIDVVNAQPTITTPPNNPLTLEQLREMDWAPVWDPNLREWGVVDIHGFSGNGCIRYINNWWHPRCLIGRRFYRREPEEETTCES